MTRITSPEGDALRLASVDLAARFPDLTGAMRARLHTLARNYDTQAAIRAQREALAAHGLSQQLRQIADRRDGKPLGTFDSRGRWVRRRFGNGGPGRPGLAHIAVHSHRCPNNDTVALCTRRLRGELDWAAIAVPGVPVADDWQPCTACLAALSEAGAA